MHTMATIEVLLRTDDEERATELASALANRIVAEVPDAYVVRIISVDLKD